MIASAFAVKIRKQLKCFLFFICVHNGHKTRKKLKKASSAHAQLSAVNGAENTFNGIISQGDTTVNNNSMQEDENV